MPQFKFRLESVLRHRQHIEKQRLRELSLVRARMAELQDQLRAVESSVKSAGDDMRSGHLTGRLDMNYLTAHRRFVTAMQRQAALLVQRMAAVQRQLDEARTALEKAAKDRKILQKLRERYQERWADENKRKELVALDEIAMQMRL